MSRDNVTPFRRPPKRPAQPQQSGGIGLKTHRGRAVFVHILTITAYAVSLLFPAPPISWVALGIAVAAVMIAVTNRTDAMPWAATHHEHALRTLVIGYAIITIASALMLINSGLVVVSFYVQLAVTIWAVIRSGVGLVLAVMRRAIWHPRGWLL